MARRRGKPSNWLATDDYTGFTRYGTQLKKDYWGAMAEKPLLRNLQEIAMPLEDPGPIPFYRGPNYEFTDNGTDYQLAPEFVGDTTVPTNPYNPYWQLFNTSPSPSLQGIGYWAISTTFVVQPDSGGSSAIGQAIIGVSPIGG